MRIRGRMTIIIALLFLSWLAACDGTDDPCSGALLAKTTSGCLRGAGLESGRRAFLGIPYAQPPIGARRFTPPTPVDPWTGIREATRFGPACPQFVRSGGNPMTLFALSVPESEDCLSLNVWTPAGASGLPVLFFIHGGADAGAGSLPVYADDPALARNAVLVTINFRFGPLGYLAHRELTEESGASGNWFLQDQILALRWVRANARAFGGDPDRILIFGQSAGGGMVSLLLFAAPPVEHLFSSALVQSAPFSVSNLRRMPLLEKGEEFGELFSRQLGCDPVPAGSESVAACLREKDVPALKTAWLALVIDHQCPCGLPAAAALVDGVVLPDQPAALLERDEFNHVPLVSGFMAQEQGPFGLSVAGGVRNWDDLEARLRDTGARMRLPDIDGLVELYRRPNEYETAAIAFDHFNLDSGYVCWNRDLLSAMNDHGVPTFGYVNDHGSSFGLLPGLPTHGVDLYFVFGSHAAEELFSSDEAAFAATLQDAWTSVAAGAPAFSGFGPWPPFPPDTLVRLQSEGDPGGGLQTVAGLRREQCDFLAGQIPFP